MESRERLFDATPYYQEAAGWSAFDVTEDDERFLLIIRTGATQPDSEGSFIYIQNFFEELKERVSN